jgi:phospholipase/carboxylesterase
VFRHERLVGYSWGPAFAHPRRRGTTIASKPSAVEIVQRCLTEGWSDPLDILEENIFSAIRTTMRALHVHSERIFLVGCGEGAALAFRLGLSYPERFAGIVSINGWMPGGFRPLARLKECRDLRILVVHGEWNGRAPVDQTRRDVAGLRAGGLRVAFQSYPCAHRITSPMLCDIDTWLINQWTKPA